MATYTTQDGRKYTEAEIRMEYFISKSELPLDVWIKDNRYIPIEGGKSGEPIEAAISDPCTETELRYKQLLHEAQEKAKAQDERIRELEDSVIQKESELVKVRQAYKISQQLMHDAKTHVIDLVKYANETNALIHKALINER